MNSTYFFSGKLWPLLLLAIGLILSFTSCNKTSKEINDLRCEYRINPLGIENTKPRLSWKIIDRSNTRGQKQTAYQVMVASSQGLLDKNKGDLWDSGKKSSNQSVNVLYEGVALTSQQKCFWKVRIWDASEEVSDWSEQAEFTIGLLDPEDWKGEWILREDQLKTEHNWYRKNFVLDDYPESAIVYVASFGYHELYVNGEKVGDEVMNPVSSFMKKRIPYLTYDVKDLLDKGNNVIAVWHAAGWARWSRVTEYMNPPFVFKAQAEIETSGNKYTLISDTTWKCKKSYSSYYGNWDILDFGGEIIDDRRREDDWNEAAYDDSDWAQAAIYNPEVLNAKITGNNISITLNGQNKRHVRKEYGKITATLSAQMVEPQVKYLAITPVEVKRNNDHSYRIDMGENYTGYFEMNLYNGSEGDSVLFEIADQEGETSTWKQKSMFIFGETGEGHFTNRFNLAGGRWVTVYGIDYLPDLGDIKGYVITNNRKRISQFECSSDLLNKIYEINLATYIANTIDGILVDCPHRERRGWGEVTVAAMYGDALPNFESGAYMNQYTQYMRDAQYSDGRIRAVINEQDRPFLMWKANSPITVWETYRMLGDKKILVDNYSSMKHWMQWLYENSEYGTGGALKIGRRGKREFPGLGDWCTPKGNFWDSSNSPDAAHFNNCVYAYMLDCAVNMALALGETEDAKVYADRLEVQRKASHLQYYNPSEGKYGNGQQVNQAFALIAGITPPAEKNKVYNQLIDEMLYNFPYYDAGSSGQALYTRYFIEEGERMDLIYELLRDTHHPGYGYFVEEGKTVWPERWSAVGNSQIHTCYTGIGGYFIKGFGGIRPGNEGYGMQNFIIKPSIVGDLTNANTSYESMYGNIVVNWSRKEDVASYHIEIPVNSTAKVYLPAPGIKNVSEGDAPPEKAKGVTYIGTEKSDAVGNYVIFKVQSGIYNFRVNLLPVTHYPKPEYQGNNLARIGRMNASSMHIVNEKNPGFEAFRANDDNLNTSWKSGGLNREWLEVEWIRPQTFNKVIIDNQGDNLNTLIIRAWESNKWKDMPVKADKLPGTGHEYTFNMVSTTKCRILFEEAKDTIEIAELKVIHTGS